MDLTNIPSYKGDAEWIKSGDHSYRASRSRNGTTKFECGTAGCTSTFVRRANGEVAPATHHNHDPELWIPNRNRMFCTLKERCIEETSPLTVIYREEAARFPDAAVHMPYEAIQSSMRRWRRSVQPPVAATLAEYGQTLGADDRYRQMHLGTVTAGGACAVILGMPGFREVLNASDTLVADGTFKTVPAGPHQHQILTLHAVCGGQFYHPVAVLMENRRRELYAAVFRALWRLADNPRPTTVVTDYEPALQAALQEVTGIVTSGCYFHFLQALCRRARSEGIDVGRNSPGNRLVRMYGALALLPPAQVPAAVAELPRAAHTDALPFNAVFHQYFMDYWMTTIGPECFSVHGRVHRTSNVAESYHASLGRSLGAAPNIWRFTQVMMEKFNICATRRRSQLAGNALLTRRNRVRQMVRAALVTNNLAALRRGAITVREFLVLTSRSITAGLEVLAAAEVPEAAQEVEVEVERERDVLVEEEHLVLVPPAPIGPDVDEQVRAVVVDVAAAPQAPRVRAPRCNVCLEPEALPTRALSPCGHTLCGDCLLGIERAAALQDRRCPFCRAYIRDVLELFF